MANIQSKKYTRTRVASATTRNKVELDNKKLDNKKKDNNRVSRQASTQMIIDDTGC